MSDIMMPSVSGGASLTDNQKLLVETRFGNQKKSVGVAYLLLFFTGIGHNFYLGRPGRAGLQFVLLFILVGFIWIFIDMFTLAGTVRERNQALYNDLTVAGARG